MYFISGNEYSHVIMMMMIVMMAMFPMIDVIVDILIHDKSFNYHYDHLCIPNYYYNSYIQLL